MLKDYSILALPVATDVTVADKKASISGLAEAIDLGLLRSYSKTAYAAGTASAKTLDFSSVTIAADTTIILRVTQGTEERVYSYYAVAGTAIDVTVDLDSASVLDVLLSRIAADGNAIVENNTSATTDLKLALKASALAGGDFELVLEGVSAPEAINTAYVAPKGTPALVRAELAPNDVSDVSDAAEYDTYLFVYDKLERDNNVGGQRVAKERKVVVYADSLAAAAAEFESKLDAVFANGSADISAAFEALAAKRLAVSTATNLTGIEGLVEVTGTTTVTLPPVAEVAAGYMIVIKNADGAATVTVEGDAAETVNGSANITLAAGVGSFIYCTGTAWLSI